MALRNFQELAVWRKAQALVDEVYKVSAAFPPEERHNLIEESRKAALAIPACIAQGYAHGSRRHYYECIDAACGKLARLEALLELSQTLGFLKTPLHERIFHTLEEMSRMLGRLRKSLTT